MAKWVGGEEGWREGREGRINRVVSSTQVGRRVKYFTQ